MSTHRACHARGVRIRFSARKNKTPSAFADGVSEFNLDDDLLSHGETPHYHRRCIVSLLSSGWGQVVPMLYGRQEIRVPNRGLQATLQQIGYVIRFSCAANSRCMSSSQSPQSVLFESQIAWVLYGQ